MFTTLYQIMIHLAVTYNNIFDIYMKKRQMIYNKKLKAGQKGGMASQRIKDLETGKEYDSVTACAEDINHDRHYISRHKERFIQI